MAKKLTKKKFNCPAEMTVSLIGGRWKTILLYNLRREPKRFGELRKLSPGITPATLAQQLRKLESHGLVLRHELSPSPNLAVEYSLTEKGESLKPVMHAMIRWGIAHQDDHVIGEFGMAKFSRRP
jgi:DNA-binding HxlR family transcriptional regulator